MADVQSYHHGRALTSHCTSITDVTACNDEITCTWNEDESKCVTDCTSITDEAECTLAVKPRCKWEGQGQGGDCLNLPPPDACMLGKSFPTLSVALYRAVVYSNFR